MDHTFLEATHYRDDDNVLLNGSRSGLGLRTDAERRLVGGGETR